MAGYEHYIAPKVFEFTRFVFGVNASPYLAQFVAQLNAKLNGIELPRASETLCKSIYMDNSLNSVETMLHHDLTTLEASWNDAMIQL